MNNLAPLLIIGTVIFLPALIAGLLFQGRRERSLVRWSERRLLRRIKNDQNRTRRPDATSEFSQFVRQIAAADYKETSLVRPNGKYYGATFGNDFIILRLPPERHEQAIADGGEKTDRKEWIGFHYDWGSPVPGKVSQQTVAQWCRVARDNADKAR